VTGRKAIAELGQMTLASAAGLDVGAIIDFERERAEVSNVGALIKGALERAGLEFAAGEPCFRSGSDEFVGASEDWRLAMNEVRDFAHLSNIHPTESK
jgi:hypothetical protein